MKIWSGAVIGSPVSHSLSPRLHNGAFDYLGLKISYSPIEVKSGELAHFLKERGQEFDYLSMTMPLKEEALSLPVQFDEHCLRIQSVNTLIRRDEQWFASSTDGPGLLAALKSAGYKSFEKVLILGAGGTARAVAGSLGQVARHISVMGRTLTRREVIQGCVQGAEFEYIPWSDSYNLHEFDLVVNTTPAGAADSLASSISQGEASLLFDVIYKPWPTVLASRWVDCGGKVLSGLDLLLFQGVDQIQKIVEVPDREGLIQHLRKVLAQ
ncbi:MAG: hypothetical protein RL313_13 [Actinomycetota bacterium]